MRENRTYGLKWRGLETWPRWNCEPTLPSNERDWKPSTYSRRASPRPYNVLVIRDGAKDQCHRSPDVADGREPLPMPRAHTAEEVIRIDNDPLGLCG
jgi:hypothetical protein